MNLTERSYPDVDPQRVGFIGLGTMGAPMAAHLLRAGHQVCVFNRTRTRAEAWVAAHGGRLAESPAEAARLAQVVFACVGNDDDLRAVTIGPDGAFETLAGGGIFVDHTTTSAEVARALSARARERGLHFIDAPVSGGNLGAINGALTVMCGADAEPFERVRALVLSYARAVTLIGPVGSGQLAKMVNQICVASLLQGLAEGLAFGQRAGLDMPAVLNVIRQGAAQSWQMENRGPTMLDDRYDFGFAVDLMRKDLGLVLAEARRNGARLPATALVDQFYAELQAQGGGRLDTSSLLRLLR